MMNDHFGLTKIEFVTTCIAIFNLIATTLLAFMNIHVLGRNTRKAIKRDVFDKYYMPLADKLEEISVEMNIACVQNSSFDIFDPKLQGESRIKRENIIKVSYKNFLGFESNLEKGYFTNKIDNDLLDVKRHMRFMVMIFGRENLMEMDKQKREYPLPDYEKIINIINSSRYKNIL